MNNSEASNNHSTMNLKSDSAWSVQVPGKWILAGEHSVLRGSPAIVFPLKSRFLNLSYKKHVFDFSIQITGLCSSDLEMIIWSVFEKSIFYLNKTRNDFKGTLLIDSHIQFGAGMGASATLAVGMTLFFKYLGLLENSGFSEFDFAKKIEDLFHGESSGVDVAIALNQKPLIFEKNKPNIFLDSIQLPKLYLSYTGTRGVTKDCVLKVKSLIQDQPELAKKIDQNMQNVVQYLIDKNFNLDLLEWKSQLDQAQSCFESWGLVSENVKKHISDLRSAGAVSCKLTGSGQGGYVLSLWKNDPLDLSSHSSTLGTSHGSTYIQEEMIPVL